MPFNGSGVYSAPSSPGAFNPAVSGGSADPTSWNLLLTDLQNALSTTITKDGQSNVTADIPFNGNKLTGVAVGVAPTDAANVSQVSGAAFLANDNVFTGTNTIGLGTLSSAVTQASRNNTTAIATTAYCDNNLIQIVTLPVNSATSAATFTGTYGLAGTAPTTATGVHVTPFDQTFTPKNANSVLELEVTLKGVLNASPAFTVALFNTTTLIDYAVFFVAGGVSSGMQTFILKTWLTPGSTSAIALKVYVGTTDGSSFNLNSFQGGSAQPGMISWLLVKEILPHLP